MDVKNNKNIFNRLFSPQKALIGMVHVQALPGTPFHYLPISGIVEQAVREAQLYKEYGFDAVIVENMHDIPYLNRQVGPEVTAAMSVVAYEVKRIFRGPVGIQILAGANREALAVALASGCDFIRAEAFVFGHIADEGFMNAQAGELLRYRKQIGAEHIGVFTDIKKKHASHAVTSDVSLVETAHTAEFFGADAVIITGEKTGSPVDEKDMLQVNKHEFTLPVMIGSGVTASNLPRLFPLADAFIVGSFLKKDGYWKNELDPDKMKQMKKIWNELK